MGVTISELAVRLGVSPMTVSRALRGVGRVGPQTRMRVLEAARELGYRPHTSARAMRTGRFGCIALLLGADPMSSVVSPERMWGLEDEVEENNSYLAVARLTEQKLVTGGPLPKILAEHMADGILVNWQLHIAPQVENVIEENRIPAVWMNVKRDSDAVYHDDERTGYEATQHLLKLGHARIAYANYSIYEGDEREGHYSFTDRRDGYLRAMKEAGLQPRLLYAVPNIPPAELARRLLDGKDAPTAVVCYGPYTHNPLMYGAALAGKRVPQDVSVITVDTAMTYDFGVKLSTMILPERQMGREAVQMLMQKLNEPGEVLPGRGLQSKLTEGSSSLPLTR